MKVISYSVYSDSPIDRSPGGRPGSDHDLSLTTFRLCLV